MQTWVPASSGFAPIALIGGWSLAGLRQPPGYDPVRDTISALAARGATDRWIMTTGLALLGACHLATAAGLTEVGRAARALLGIGGAATVVVAASPQPNAAHVPAATVAFVALAVWPAVSRPPQRVCSVGDVVLRRVGLGAAIILVGLLCWLGSALGTGVAIGLSERALAGAQAVCPLAVVILLVRRRGAVP